MIRHIFLILTNKDYRMLRLYKKLGERYDGLTYSYQEVLKEWDSYD